MSRQLAALCSVLLASCGATAGSARGGGETGTWSGTVRFESRHPTTTGASDQIALRPARSIDLVLVAEGGEIVAEGRTDDEGRFTIEGPSTARTLRAFARVRARGHDAAISSDGMGRDTHSFDTPLADGPMDVRALDREGDAGAFHVVDAMLRGLDTVHEWTGVTLPPVFAYWVRGGTREWSYYRGERPEGSGRFALELLGGDPGQASISDTDEHDEAIVLHELGHFVMDRLTTDSSTGGMHPRGVPIDPGLAWEEGRATWFALSVLRDPRYRDTIGIEPWGSLRVDEDVEVGPDEHPGISSETSVAKVLWDLADGGESGMPDRDDDGIALGPAAVLRAMVELSRVEGAFPCLASFMEFVRDRSITPREGLSAMLQRTSMPEASLFAADAAPLWPRTLAMDAQTSARIDGVTQPAPSTGGVNLPGTGFDAIHTYRVRVTEVGMLVVRLEITGSGRIADRQDLDLELLDLRADRLAGSATENAREALSRIVQPGWYIVRVRDGGQGNRADYRLHVGMEVLGGAPLPSRP